MHIKSLSSFILLALPALVLILGACSIETDVKQQTANHIARPAFMVDRMVPAGDFKIQSWERMHAPNQTANVYIEGDSYQQIKSLNKGRPGVDYLEASPENPVALHLASRDNSKNVVYLARPCQYVKNAATNGCDPKYWNESRFAPEVLDAYDAALNEIARRYDITGFNLIGYDGGANIAAVLAARRGDVLSLRTVAGNLNPDLAADNNIYEPLSRQSVYGIDYGTALANVPQHHFVGAADAEITPSIYHSYRQMVGMSDCIHYSLVQDADHTRGWVEKWPELLKLEPQCAVVHTNLPSLPPPEEYPGDYYKGMGKTKYSK